MPVPWTVLAPGPSLKRWVERGLRPPGPVVAINSAVMSGIPVDFWSCQDPPRKFEHIWSEVPVDLRRMTCIWCKEQNEEAWRELGYRTWAHPSNEREFRLDWCRGVNHDNPSLHWTSLSFTMTLARVASLTTHVDIYGCDLEGSGYAYGHDTLKRMPIAWSNRWKGEHTVTLLAIAKWEALHRTIRRRPAPP